MDSGHGSGDDMLPDGEDLLQQLSGELGLPEFMDDVSMLDEAAVDATGTSLYDQLMTGGDPVFSEIMRHDALLTPDSLKTEPLSPHAPSATISFPPSPSNSDSSASDNVNIRLMTPPVSPPTNYQQQLMVNNAFMSNVKIPIPKVVKPQQTLQQTTNTASSPLILTSQQLAQLTQNGVLKVATATSTNATSASSPIVIKQEPASSISPLNAGGVPTVQSAIPIERTVVGNGADMKALKRQQRMIKNRESACLSRKKKKEYVTNLEDQINLLSQENHELKRDNEVLRAKVRELESEKTLWTDTVLSGSGASSAVKKGTALFALLCVVSLNVGTLSNMYNSQQTNKMVLPNTGPLEMPSSSLGNGAHLHSGRSLLWASEDDEDSPQLPSFDNKDMLNNTKNMMLTKCPMYFNQSESIRLDNQLRGWFQLDPIVVGNASIEAQEAAKFVKRQDKERKAAASESYETSLGHYVKPAVQSLTGSIYHMLIAEPAIRQHNNLNGLTERGEISLYDSETPRFTYESFFEAIDRREDTFYVVSFSGDHLLLPASSRNQSIRPRMSLLLPSVTVPMNDSMQPPPNHVAMMQIDCEVVNTRLLHIREDAIPLHLSEHMRASHANASLQRNDSSQSSNSGTSAPTNVSRADGYKKKPSLVDDGQLANNNTVADSAALYVNKPNFVLGGEAARKPKYNNKRKLYKRQQHRIVSPGSV